MKRIFISILLIVFSSASTVMSEDSKAAIQTAKTLLDEIVARKSQQPGWDEAATAIESGRQGLRTLPDFVALEKVLSGSSPQIVGNINTVATSELSKAILFVACQSLRPDDYLQFLNQAVGLAEHQTIDKRLLKWGLFPADKNVRGVLDYNYDKPVTKDILQRVKVLYAGDRDMIKYCDATLSGETKRNVEQYFSNNPSEPRPGPALNGETAVPKSSPPPDVTPSPATPVPSMTPRVSSQPATPTTQTPAATVDHKAPVWPWMVGILALIVIVALVFKRRA